MIVNFIDKNTVITADWLNKVDRTVSEAIGDGTNVPTSPTEVKQNLDLENVDNTSDINKPVSTAQQAAIDLKADIVNVNTQLNLKSDISTTVTKDSTTGACRLPAGTAAQRPSSPIKGDSRFNETDNTFEIYDGVVWQQPASTSAAQTFTNKTLFATTNIIEAKSGPDVSPLSHRNKIINGNFAINQRAYVSGAAVGAGLYGHDRWKMAASGDTYTFSTANNKTTVTIPSGKVLQQVIEGINLQTGTYVLSWEGTAQGKIGGGSYAASGVTASITGGTNTTIEFGPGTLANVQLEIGQVATPFEPHPLQAELMLCQRYYESGFGQMIGYGQSAGAGLSQYIPFKVQKRVSPTLTYGSTFTSNVAAYDIRNASVDGARWYCNAAATGTMQWDGTWTASAEL